MSNGDYEVVPPYAPYSGSKYKLIKKSRLFRDALTIHSRHGVLHDMFCGTGSIAVNPIGGSGTVYAYEYDKHIAWTLDWLNSGLSRVGEVIDEIAMYTEAEVDYYDLRAMFNATVHNSFSPAMFIALQHRSFNSLVRFNKSGAFNAPKGMKDINLDNIRAFVRRLQKIDVRFIDRSVLDVGLRDASVGDKVYADPPYFLASENDQNNPYDGSWGNHEEMRMREILESVHASGAEFALSNVTFYRGRRNDSLIDWAESNGFLIYALEHGYRMWSAAVKSADPTGKTQECIVTNFPVIQAKQ